MQKVNIAALHAAKPRKKYYPSLAACICLDIPLVPQVNVQNVLPAIAPEPEPFLPSTSALDEAIRIAFCARIEVPRARAAVGYVRDQGLKPPVCCLVLSATSPSLQHGAYESAGRWIVESLAVGNNTVDENGLEMASGVLHASARAKAANESFHPIEWDAAIFAGVRDGKLNLQSYFISSGAPGPICTIPAPRGSRQDAQLQREEIVAGHVYGFLRR